MKKRVLIMSASAGSGHVRAAEALERKFSQDDGAAEVVHEDALRFGSKPFRDFYSKLYIRMVRSSPQVLGALYRASDSPWKTDSVRIAMDRLNMRPLVKFIDDFRPHITVCTHFMPAGIIDHLLENGIALKSNELTTVAFKVDRLLEDPARLAAMRSATRRLARPGASRTIVDTLMRDELPPLSFDEQARHAMKKIAATARGSG